MPNDSRLPHISKKLHAQIQKTALGAEKSVAWRHSDDIVSEIAALKDQGVRVIALEQAPHSVSLVGYVPHSDIALLLGEEVAGIAPQLQALCDQVIEIPMLGEKESLNVSVAAAIAMYQLANH
jgi:tRNA G18 (ribose-2'-O)-methylase SpoU